MGRWILAKSLRALVWTTTAALVALATTVILTLFATAADLRVATDDLGDAADEVRATEQTEADLLAFNREHLLFALTGQDVHAVASQRAAERIRRWMVAAKRTARTPDEAVLVAEVARRFDRYIRSLDSRPASAPALSAYHDTVPLFEATAGALDRLAEHELRELHAAHAIATAQSRRAELVATIAAGVLVLGVAGVLGAFAVVVGRPVLAIREAIRRFGRGDRGARAPEKGPLELREIAIRFNEMADTLGRQQQRQLEFLAGIAHDLRNPLSAVASAAALLDPSRPKSDHDQQKFLAIVGRQVTRLDRMVSDLLDVARIESGMLELRPVVCDLGDIASEVVDLYRQVSAAHEVVLSVPPNMPAIRCDPTRIAQVLGNLVSNAIKYSPKGGRVEVGIASARDEALITVSDRGIGIAREDQERIFEPFRRTSASRETIPGVGLGLSVVRRIVEAHGGRIEVESRPGSGSTFRVWLPAAGPPESVERAGPAELRPNQGG